MKKAVSLGWILPQGQGVVFDRRPTATAVIKRFDLAKDRVLNWYPLDAPNPHAPPLTQSEIVEDPRQDPVYQDSVNRRDELMTAVHRGRWSSDSWAITLYQPLFDQDDSLRLVLMADLDLRALSMGLRDLKLPPGTALMILDGQGRLLATSLRQTDEERGMRVPEQLSAVADNQHPAIRAVHLAVQKAGGYEGLGTGWFTKQQGPDDLYYIRTGALNTPNGPSWSYAIATSRQVLIAPLIAGTRVTVLVAGGLLLLAILAGGLLARWITRPILLLGHAAAAVKAHCYESPEMPIAALERESRRSNEFGQLAALFVRMIHEVRERHRLLEAQLEQLRVHVDPTETQQRVQSLTETAFFKKLQTLRGRSPQPEPAAPDLKVPIPSSDKEP
jgi:HAMP domain-containing protein